LVQPEPVFQASPTAQLLPEGRRIDPKGLYAQIQLLLSARERVLAEVVTDTQTSMPSGIPEGAMCVQRFDDSLNSAIHITYRISLRSSSMREPRDPLLKVVFEFFYYSEWLDLQIEDV
jgi:hypothetical protein